MNLFRLTKNTSLLIVLSVIFLFYELVAFCGVYLVDLKGSSVDAGKFHDLAIQWAGDPQFTVNIGVRLYTQILGSIYYFAPYQIVGVQLSIAAMVCAAWLITRFFRSQNIRHTALTVLIIFMWPSLVFRTATTMREPLLLLAIVCFLTSLVYYIQKERLKDLAIAIIAGTGLFLLHKATGLITVAVLGFALAYVFLFTKISLQKKLLFLFCFVFMVAVSTVFIRQHSELREMRVLSTIAASDWKSLNTALEIKHNRAVALSRAAYDAPILFNNPIDFAVSTCNAFFHYMCEPLPNRLQTPPDLYGFAEVLLRLFLIAFIISRWKRMHTGIRFLFLAYLIMSLVWATGTTNYGTASRHHAVGLWIILVIAKIVLESKKTINHELNRCARIQ